MRGREKKMKRRYFLGLCVMLLALLMVSAAAFAADVFRFDPKTVDIFEGESTTAVLIREEKAAEDGELTWSVDKPKIVSVTEDGTVTGLTKGEATVTVRLKIGKSAWKAQLKVRVLRRVTNVTLNTGKLTVYLPDDGAVSDLLEEETDYKVIVIAAGKSADLKATCTPSDATNRKVVFLSTDEGILSVSATAMKAVQAGECDLIASSQQNPEIVDVYHVLVIQPVKTVTIQAETKTVFAGESLQLAAGIEPSNASIQTVKWSSQNPNIATVDEDGVVTGIKKGNAIIQASAVDGSQKTGVITIQVGQRAESVSLDKTTLNLAVGKTGQLKATVLPNEASDRTVAWFTSDPSVATVNNQGKVNAAGRGSCTITAVSASDASLTASAEVNVIQPVTSLTFDDKSVSLHVYTTRQLRWTISPYDADIQDVTFSSSNTQVAVVNAEGVVSGVSRGTVTITAATTDGSNRKAQIKVQVTQPVEGVSMQYATYRVQLDDRASVKAIIEPSNASNTKVNWVIGDDNVATVKNNNSNIGTVYGRRQGTTTVTAITEDGGFEASALVQVADFNRSVVVDDVYLENEKIRLTFRNRSDFTVSKVYFRVECFNLSGIPVPCNTDGSGFFTGVYALELQPGECTQHNSFTFQNFMQPIEPIIGMNVYITGWTDSSGYTRNIPESRWPVRGFYRYLYQTNTPLSDSLEELDEGDSLDDL